MPADATDALRLQDTTPAKRWQEGPSARKRKQARAENEAPAPIDDDKSVDKMADAIPGDEGGVDPSASEVSDDEGSVEVGNDSSAKGVNPLRNPKSQPLAIAKKSNDRLYDNGDNDMEALGSLNHEPHSVGSIFTRRAADEQLAGLDVAARVSNTTKQLLGDSPAAQKLAWATAASKERAYLVVMGANKYFTLIHHLTIMDVELRPRDPIKGQLVSFEAEMREYGAPPRLVVFDGPATDLFQLLRPQLGSQRAADAAHTWGGRSDKHFLGVRAPSDPPADWPALTTRLIPIPMAWAAYFLDRPDFGVAVRRFDTLVDSVSRLEHVQFAPSINSLLLGCYGHLHDKKSAYSLLSLDWDPLPLHPKTKGWMQDRWTRVTGDKAGDSSNASDSLPDSEDERELPPRRSTQAPSPRRKVARVTRARVAPAAARPAAAPTVAASAAPAGFTIADLGPLVTQILHAQAESNLQLHQSFQTNMLANIRATLTALAATGGSKESKLLDSKLRILQACSGHGDLPSFGLSKFYAELDKNGITLDNCGMVLCRLVVTVHGSANQCNVHISPKVIATAKTLNFSHNNDCTFVG
jgi:hypothetical protein